MPNIPEVKCEVMHMVRPWKLPRFLNKLEIDAMFSSSKNNPRDSLMLKCMFYLGLRVSELQNLKIEDIDLLNSTVKIICGKGKKDRYVPIPCSDLSESIKHFSAGRYRGLLITGQDHVSKMTARHILRVVKKYAVLAGIRKPEEIHNHTLRHSYATYLQDRGVPLNAIQQLLGHEDIETTFIYLHLGIGKIHVMVTAAFDEHRAEPQPSFACN